ncbi:phosphatidylinositol transfer protein SFH5, partial [Patellaria atrata CBS 101060]
QPTKTSTPVSSEPVWPELTPEHPISKLLGLLPDILDQAAHNEVYGVTLKPEGSFHTKLILQKFLRANANDIEKAKTQLLGTLKWRKEFEPWNAAKEVYSRKNFGGLGYIIELEDVPESPNKKDIATFNIYGAVEDNKATFGDLDGFIRWRVGLMERGIQKLSLPNATKPIPDHGAGPDPYQGIQIHDYLSVSFLRQDPLVKAASKKTIEIMQAHYPETLARKFFVNVPLLMGWMFTAMKLFLAKETVRKFTVLSYGNQLVNELGKSVPASYGGTGSELDMAGETLKL